VAGVSRTTVSFVLNGVTDQAISAATRAKVRAVAEQLGYEPNATARSLVGGATDTVALLVPQTAHLYVDAFLAQFLASVNETCHHSGLKLLIESMEGGGRTPGSFTQLVRSRRIDGLIVVNPRVDELDALRRLRDARIPLVAELPDGLPHETVGQDTERSAQLPVQHLIGLGHRRIAFVNFARNEYRAGDDRERGWRTALEAHGLQPDRRLVAQADISAGSGYAATRELLARGVAFSALFAGNDTIAFGALRALTEAGRRVPADVALVGYDDIPLAAFASPPLTTVRTDPVGHGRRAVQMLLAQLRPKGPGVAAEAAEAPRLVVRESCGASPQQVATGPAAPKRVRPVATATKAPAPTPAPRRRTAR